MLKTIIHVIDSLRTGGAEKLLVQTVNSLQEYNNIVCYLHGPTDLKSEFKKCIFYDLGFKNNLDILNCSIRLRKIIRQVKPDIIHAHLLKSTWISRLANDRGRTLLFTIHNILSEDAFKVNKLSYYFEKLSYSSKQVIISVSNAALDDYKKWIGLKGASYVLYNPIDDRFFTGKKCKSVPTGNLKLVAVGNLKRQKNYFTLLQAFHFLKGTKVDLDIFGEGPEYYSLEKEIIKNNFPVRLMGKNNDIASMLLNYDAYIMPSLFEGYGIAPVEAMASGLPVLLSNIQVLKEVSSNKAIYFDPLEPQDIARAIKDFIQMNEIEKIELSKSLMNQAVSIGDQKQFKSRLLEIYNSIN